MSYTVYDFSESLSRASAEGIDRANVSQVIAAWGVAGDGSEWSGGFLLALSDGRRAYLAGWCDYTGWGCQDGISVEFYAPGSNDITGVLDPAAEWDKSPNDLNRYLRGEIDEFFDESV